jgi:hypothetical protein
MTIHRAIFCALALTIAAPAAAATQAAPKKAAAKKAPPGRTETLACRLGTEDRHARIAVVVIRGKTDSFAYYSKWKPRTCSVYLQRKGDMYSKWADNGNITTVSLEKGAFLIEHKPGEYHFIFRDIDRERYCGMDGVINGSLTIKRGSDQCILDGEIMVEGTPLGEAHAAREPQGPLQAAGASDVAQGGDAASSPEKPAQQKPAAATPAPAEKPQPGAANPSPAAADKPPAGGANASPVPAEKPQAAAAATPAADEKKSAAVATPAADGKKAAASSPEVAQKPAEPPSSGSSIGAFFRSLKPRPAEGQSP